MKIPEVPAEAQAVELQHGRVYAVVVRERLCQESLLRFGLELHEMGERSGITFLPFNTDVSFHDLSAPDDGLVERIAQRVFEKLEAADDAREAAARPPDQCPTCGEKAVEYSAHSDAERKFACKHGCGKWTAPWMKL